MSIKRKNLGVYRDLLFLLVGFTLLFLAFYGLDYDKLESQFWKVNFWWLILAKLISLIAHYIRAARWKLLITTLQYNPRTLNLFYGTLIGYLTNMVTPKLGDFARCFSVKRTDKVPASELLGTLIVERAIDILVLIIIVGSIFLLNLELLTDFFFERIAYPLTDNVVYYVTGWRLVAVLLMVFLLLLFLYFTRIRLFKNSFLLKAKRLKNGIIGGIKTIAKLQDVGLFIVYTALMWLTYIFVLYISFMAFDTTAHLSFSDAYFIQAFRSMGWAIPVQAGIGTFHWAVAQGLMLLGITYTDGFLFATIVHALGIMFKVLVGSLALIAVLWKIGKTIRFKNIKQIIGAEERLEEKKMDNE